MLSDQKVTFFKALAKALEMESDILNLRTVTISSNLGILVVERGATLASFQVGVGGGGGLKGKQVRWANSGHGHGGGGGGSGGMLP